MTLSSYNTTYTKTIVQCLANHRAPIVKILLYVAGVQCATISGNSFTIPQEVTQCCHMAQQYLLLDMYL